MNKMHTASIFSIGVMLATSIAGPVRAAGVEDRGKLPPKHDSNTLHKLGNAIQYPFRKAGENMSVTTHRATGKNSVVKDQMRSSTEVVKPAGKTIVIAKDSPRIGWEPAGKRTRYMHRRRHNFMQEGRTYYWFNNHRYYLDQKTGERIKID